MKREILFRGKRTENGEWVEGLPHKGYDDTWFISNGIDTWRIQRETLGQFTGLTDKDGYRIFEGDIVFTPTEKHMAISWSERFASYVVDRDGWAFSHWFGESIEAHQVKVVGNVWDNPELLKGGTR
ncbi:YopX family protein [Parapedobacter indicus]|uniref:Phage uncharacterized protein TIGR01671 n=1 Tax=Parapedobacter indicus TaxID=1477437 RepID=A0A1I3E5B9_9SPHI|nr:YopX family protein [Parapedobacter indicus]PPL04966.1 putative phage protein (TIGR01671 family) [Parapedobacter indicus]SFH93901.1 phage uncharacterized protein TIGR01671 [Parapedobacter indicus]